MRLLIAALLALTGCALPRIDSKDMPGIVEQVVQSNASACMWIGGRGGGGAGVLTPAAGGGYGSGEVLMGRVNSPNTRLEIADGKCTIERGSDDSGN